MAAIRLVRKYWFMFGLLAVALLAVLDASGITVRTGLWMKRHHGPDLIILLIFFFSGIALETNKVRAGLGDISGTALALAIIFIAGPLLGMLFVLLPLPMGVLIGILLVSVMPTTLSSGVVMTGSAGGNMAHALLITIVANILAVITIPVTLGLLMGFTGESRVIEIDKLPIMLKIGRLVVVPLLVGMLLRRYIPSLVRPFIPHTATINQLGILTVVWMGACQGREAIVTNFSALPAIVGVTGAYHLALLAIGFGVTSLAAAGKTRRESIILMGAQKTLPLSIILQVSLFSEFGLALAVCVIHHIVHLAMDAFVVNMLRGRS